MKKQLNNFYVVQKNDNIDTIARMYNISAMSILITNSITPSMIKEGVVLYVPL